MRIGISGRNLGLYQCAANDDGEMGDAVPLRMRRLHGQRVQLPVCKYLYRAFPPYFTDVCSSFVARDPLLAPITSTGQHLKGFITGIGIHLIDSTNVLVGSYLLLYWMGSKSLSPLLGIAFFLALLRPSVSFRSWHTSCVPNLLRRMLHWYSS